MIEHRACRTNAVAAIALAALLLPQTALAFAVQLQGGNVLRWHQNTIPFTVHEAGSDDIDNGDDFRAIARAVASWNNIACSALVLEDQGKSSERDIILTTSSGDGVNRLVWIEDRKWPFGRHVLGVTTPLFDGRGEISEADIGFNGALTEWSTDGSRTDVESVALHELGHFFGLQHHLGGEALADPPTMAPSVDPGLLSRDPNADDRRATCFLYPVGEYVCAGNWECPWVLDDDARGQEYYPGRLACGDDNRCKDYETAEVAPPVLGDPCALSAAGRQPEWAQACSDGLYCQRTRQTSVCVQSCVPSEPGGDPRGTCPAGFRCLDGPAIASPLARGVRAVCLPDSIAADTDPNTYKPKPETPELVCTCDTSTLCQSGCGCDMDCVDACLCDLTTGCDSGCACDGDCGGGGCMTIGFPVASAGAQGSDRASRPWAPQSAGGPALLVALAFCGSLWRGSRRRARRR